MSALTIFFWIICACIAIVATTTSILFVFAGIKEIKRTLNPTDKEE